MVQSSQPAIPVEFYGFYELDAEGIVRHADLSYNKNLKNLSADDLVGRSFFKTVLPALNADELEHYFQIFVSSQYTTKAFKFDALISGRVIPLSVMFVRVWQNFSSTSQRLYFIDIKPEWASR